MSNDLQCLGMNFDTWQDAVEAAIASDRLYVIGEVRGGQLIQYADPSGARMTILAVAPFATFVNFEAQTACFAHVSMLDDVVALCEIVDYNGNSVCQLTCNLAQGPLLVDEPIQQWQQIGLTALVEDCTVYTDADHYRATTGKDASVGYLQSPSVDRLGDGSAQPADASAQFLARVLDAETLTNELTGQQYIHATVDGSFAFDLCLPADRPVPEKGAIIEGTALLTGSLMAPQGCGGGGCGGGGCGCGGH